MKRMRTFLLYALGIIGFIILSLILEDGLINSMYKPLTDSSDKYIANDSSGLAVEVTDARASTFMPKPTAAAGASKLSRRLS